VCIFEDWRCAFFETRSPNCNFSQRVSTKRLVFQLVTKNQLVCCCRKNCGTKQSSKKGPKGKRLVESSGREPMHRHARNQASAARPPIRLHLSDEEERAHSNASTPTKEMRGIEGMRSKLAWPLTGEEFTIAKAGGTSVQRQHVPVLDGE
jgi:hypothetical protein